MEQPRATTLASPTIVREPPHDRKEPGRKRPRPFESCRVTMNDDEGGLRNILGVVHITEQLRSKQRRRPHVATDEDSERLVVTMRRVDDELRIGTVVILHSAPYSLAPRAPSVEAARLARHAPCMHAFTASCTVARTAESAGVAPAPCIQSSNT